MENLKQLHNSSIIREATIEDMIKYKRGKKDVNPKDYYLCQCDCGNYWVPSKKNYKKGLSTSCGKHSNDGRFINEIGNHYGELTVIEEAPAPNIKIDHHKYWLCQCSCGNLTIAAGKDLRQNKINSCGCIKSKGAKLISNLLSASDINYIGEYKFEDLITDKGYPYRFDWAIFKNNQLFCLLEYDGEQHFDKNNNWYRESVDEIKNQYCKEHNINLYRISYKDFNKLSIEFIKNIIHYEGE